MMYPFNGLRVRVPCLPLRKREPFEPIIRKALCLRSPDSICRDSTVRTTIQRSFPPFEPDDNSSRLIVLQGLLTKSSIPYSFQIQSSWRSLDLVCHINERQSKGYSTSLPRGSVLAAELSMKSKARIWPHKRRLKKRNPAKK